MIDVTCTPRPESGGEVDDPRNLFNLEMLLPDSLSQLLDFLLTQASLYENCHTLFHEQLLWQILVNVL